MTSSFIGPMRLVIILEVWRLRDSCDAAGHKFGFSTACPIIELLSLGRVAG